MPEKILCAKGAYCMLLSNYSYSLKKCDSWFLYWKISRLFSKCNNRRSDQENKMLGGNKRSSTSPGKDAFSIFEASK